MSLIEAPLIDQHIHNFHVIELIGYGAMATVYRAFDIEQERDIALKIPDPKYAQNPRFMERFRREAEAMAKLCHKNIVRIYGAGEYEGVPFLAMEYVSGVSLAKILAEREQLEIDEAVEYILQVSEAMECAHQTGIIHRDLKPSNILAESSGRVLVADFGISKIVSGNEVEDTLTFVGTPTYMSPEQCGEGVLDQRTDIYSLGIIFFEMIVGRPPFRGTTPAEIIKSHLMDTVKFPTEQKLHVPPKIINIIRRMLAKDPQQRHPDARSLIRDLELWRKETATTTRQAPDVENEILSEAGPLVLCYVPQKVLHGAVVSALNNINHKLLTVASSSELIEKLSYLKPKMVIISHEPRRTTVFRLAEKIKHRFNSQIHITMLSHGISRDEVEMAFRMGVTDIVAEPFDPSILVSKLEAALVGEQRSIESRRFFRKQISGKITVRVESEILDISEGGMRIATNMALKIGEVVRFESNLFRQLGLGEKAGRIVWISRNNSEESQSAFQAGVDFVDLTRTERDTLRKWIFASEIAAKTHHTSVERPPSMGPYLKK